MIWAVLRVVVLAYVGLGVVLYFFQSYMIFPGGGSVHSTPGRYSWSYNDVTVEPMPGETSYGWFVHAAGESRGVVLFSTGNAGTIADRSLSIGQFRDIGFDVCIYDYGGYGESSGRPSEERIYADVRAFWSYLVDERGVDPERIVLFGRSLGSGPTCQLATEVTPRAIILESAFLSTVDIARELLPIYPVSLMVRHRFDNASKIAEISVPILFIHSPYDEVIPFDHGRALYEMANEPKEFLEIRGGHNDGFLVSERQYEEGLIQFLHPLFPLDGEDGEE